MTVDLETRELDWTSDDPHLSGAYAPVGPEIEAADLPVVSGRIPPDLSGVYMRNGSNPRFKPIAYNYPFDGDGMVHAVYFDNGRARYKNRYVRTRGLAVERRAGRAVYGSLLRPAPVDPALVGPDGERGPFKTGAFINVMSHGGHLLALGEAQPSYELTRELETIGEWTAGGAEPLRLGAHNRVHRATGDLYALAYTPFAAKVFVHRIDPAGRRLATFPVDLAAPSMIHDFVLTQDRIVLVIGPAVFDLAGAAAGKSPLQWRADQPTRIGVIALDGSEAAWVEAPPFFVFHFANGFARGDEIVVDYVRHDSLRLGYGPGEGGPPTLRRLVVDPANKTTRDEPLADFATEFPRINDGFQAAASRFVYVPAFTQAPGFERPAGGGFNAIVKVDAETGEVRRCEFGARLVGEPAFIPRPGATGEDDGYLATFVFDPARGGSDFALIDARRPEAEPVATIRLPQRVPQGLHGNWIAAA